MFWYLPLVVGMSRIVPRLFIRKKELHLSSINKFHDKLGNCKTSGCSTRSRSICGWAGLTQPDGRHADQRDPILAGRGV